MAWQLSDIKIRWKRTLPMVMALFFSLLMCTGNLDEKEYGTKPINIRCCIININISAALNVRTGTSSVCDGQRKHRFSTHHHRMARVLVRIFMMCIAVAWVFSQSIWSTNIARSCCFYRSAICVVWAWPFLLTAMSAIFAFARNINAFICNQWKSQI